MCFLNNIRMNKILISGLMLVFMLAFCFSACSNAQQAGIEVEDNQNGLQMSAATESGDELSQLKPSQSEISLDIQPSNTSRLDRIATTIKPATTETFPPTQRTNIPTNDQKATPLPTNSPDIDRLDALIQITSPGQGSVVVSPIILDMELDPNDAQTLIVELRDQDGRLLVRQLDSLFASELVTRSFSKVIVQENGFLIFFSLACRSSSRSRDAIHSRGKPGADSTTRLNSCATWRLPSKSMTSTRRCEYSRTSPKFISGRLSGSLRATMRV